MVEADVIVLASPVYFYAMSAQMKTLIDRCCSEYLRMSNKEFYFIITAAEQDKGAMERVIEGFRGFLDCLEGARERARSTGSASGNARDRRTSRPARSLRGGTQTLTRRAGNRRKQRQKYQHETNDPRRPAAPRIRSRCNSPAGNKRQHHERHHRIPPDLPAG